MPVITLTVSHSLNFTQCLKQRNQNRRYICCKGRENIINIYRQIDYILYKNTREWKEKLLELMRKFSKIVKWRYQCPEITAETRD